MAANCLFFPSTGKRHQVSTAPPEGKEEPPQLRANLQLFMSPPMVLTFSLCSLLTGK